ncbi:Kelch repeat type 1 [Dillenia turbinata]|uniref:Kelch repeat type 1 n=1 Tax=Dillenia turbinata TaxID=194707 RepID=A0AAN8UKQ1_9MAGN
MELKLMINKDCDNQDDGNEYQPLIPGLPDEVAEICLLHLPYPYHVLVRSVSCSWNKLISNPSFLLSRKSLSLPLPFLFVFAFNKSTASIQWQALDPRSGRWFLLPPMPCPKSVCPSGFACASIPLQGTLVVLGGMRTDSRTTMRTNFIYRTSTNRWSMGSPMMISRSCSTAKTVGGKIYAVGGTIDGDGFISAVECYDPESDTWRAVAKMRAGLARYDAAVLGGKVCVTEGWTWPFSFSPRGEVYDAESDTWQPMRAGMREGWTGISVVLGKRLFVIPEHGDCRMKVYRPDRDTWEFVGGDRFPCEAVQRPFAVSGLDGKIYVVACGLHVAVGRVYDEGEDDEKLRVEWEVMAAPSAFGDLLPSNCEVLYA